VDDDQVLGLMQAASRCAFKPGQTRGVRNARWLQRGGRWLTNGCAALACPQSAGTQSSACPRKSSRYRAAIERFKCPRPCRPTPTTGVPSRGPHEGIKFYRDSAVSTTPRTKKRPRPRRPGPSATPGNSSPTSVEQAERPSGGHPRS
jgi:hypothetical protein